MQQWSNTTEGVNCTKNVLISPMTFTGKERDAETGFSYYGARYYDPELSALFLSVDPCADKYPGISPYAYCAWNPVKLVDPDGREIDDYFSENGKYLGSDNSSTNYVRIISEAAWNLISKDENGMINHDVGYVSSVSFSDACTKYGMSDDAQLKIYEHYNPTNYNVEAAPNNEIKTSNHGMITKIGCLDKKTDQAVVNHLYIKMAQNRTPNSFGEAMCDNADEIINAFVHERNHIRRALKMGYSKWYQMNSTREGKKNIEKSAIATQRMHSSWKGCRPGFIKGVDNYENSL